MRSNIALNSYQSRALHVLDATLNGASSEALGEALETEEIEGCRINPDTGEKEFYLKRVPKTGFYSSRHYS